MIRFKFRYCQVLMARYISDDLSDTARRRVARYIGESEDCYREYMRHREFTRKLDSNLAQLGRPDAVKMDRLWSNLQAELDAPVESAWLRDSRSPSSLSFSYGVALTALAIALLVPLMIGYQAALVAVDLPRMPQLAGIVRTPGASFDDSPLIIAASHMSGRPSTRLLQNTPSPQS